MDWRARARCRSMDPDLFFPFDGDKRATEEAKAFCRNFGGCPVMAECLAEAMNGQHDGVWGGTSKVDRSNIRRARTRALLRQGAAQGTVAT